MNIVKVFAQGGIGQGIQFFDDPTGKFDFGVSAADLADVLGVRVSDLVKSINAKYTSAGNSGQPVPLAELILWEYGIYQGLMKTRSKVAIPFQEWLAEEVIPSIRKTGGYGAQKKLTANQQKIIDYTHGQTALQADLVERCVIFHTPALAPKLPRINPQPTVDLVLAEQARSGLELDRCDVVMRYALEAECIRQVERDGAIKTMEVWSAINSGASETDPNERRSLKWVADEIEKLLHYWGMDWTGKSRSRAVMWNLSAK